MSPESSGLGTILLLNGPSSSDRNKLWRGWCKHQLVEQWPKTMVIWCIRRIILRRYKNIFKPYGYGLREDLDTAFSGRLTPQNSLVSGSGFLHFWHLKLLVIKPQTSKILQSY